MKLYDVLIKFKDSGKDYRDDGSMGWLIQADSSSDAIRAVFAAYDSGGREFYQINVSENRNIKQIVLEADRKKFDEFKEMSPLEEAERASGLYVDADLDPIREVQIKIDKETSEQSKALIKAAEDDVHECGPAC